MVLQISLKNELQLKLNIFTTSLPKFTAFHQRKHENIHCQFCILCSFWRHKMLKNTDVYLRFRPQRARAIVKLYGATLSFYEKRVNCQVPVVRKPIYLIQD